MASRDDFENLMKETFKEEYEGIKIGATFAAQLVKARLAQKLTQSELAKKAGLKQSAIARIENKGTLPRIDTVYKIMKALNKDFDFFSNNQEDNSYIKVEDLSGLISSFKDEIRELREEFAHVRRYMHTIPKHLSPSKYQEAPHRQKVINGYVSFPSRTNVIQFKEYAQ